MTAAEFKLSTHFPSHKNHSTKLEYVQTFYSRVVENVHVLVRHLEVLAHCASHKEGDTV